MLIRLVLTRTRTLIAIHGFSKSHASSEVCLSSMMSGHTELFIYHWRVGTGTDILVLIHCGCLSENFILLWFVELIVVLFSFLLNCSLQYKDVIRSTSLKRLLSDTFEILKIISCSGWCVHYFTTQKRVF